MAKQKTLFFLLLFSFLLFSPVVLATGLLDGLNYQVSFDEGSGYNASMNNGTVQDFYNSSVNPTSAIGVAWNPNGVIGSASMYNGSAHEFTTTFNAGVASQFMCIGTGGCHNTSFSFWLNPNTYDTQQPIIYGAHTSTSVRIYYDAGYSKIQYRHGNTSFVCFVESAPIIVNSWTHVVWTIDEDDNATAYVNGQETSITGCPIISTSGTSTTEIDFGGDVTGGSNFYFNGSIDEISYWGERTLDSGEVLALYNNGNGLPYSTYSQQLPQQIGNIPDVQLNQSQTRSLFMNNYFSDYNDFYVSFFDTETSNSVSLHVDATTIDQATYNTSYITVELTSFGPVFDNDVRLLIRSNTSDFDTTMTALGANDLGNAFDSFDVTVNGEPIVTNPIQIAGFKTPVVMGYNQSTLWSMDIYYANFDGIKLNFIDDITNVPVEIQTETDQSSVSYANAHYNVSLIPFLNNSIKMIVVSNDSDSDIVMTVSAFYEVSNGTFHTISDDLTVQIRRFGGTFTTPPVQIKDLDVVILDAGDTVSLKIYEYMEDYTASSLLFTDTANDTDVILINGNSYNQGDFNVEMINDRIILTGIGTLWSQSMILKGSNQAGTLEIPFTVQTSATQTNITNFRSVVGFFVYGLLGLFPDSSGISLKEKMSFVFLSFIVTIAMLLVLFTSLGTYEYFGMVTSIILTVEALFFVATGYIPKTIVVIVVLIAGGIGFLMFRGRG